MIDPEILRAHQRIMMGLSANVDTGTASIEDRARFWARKEIWSCRQKEINRYIEGGSPWLHDAEDKGRSMADDVLSELARIELERAKSALPELEVEMRESLPFPHSYNIIMALRNRLGLRTETEGGIAEFN